MDSKSIAMAILLLCTLEFHMVVSLSSKIPKGAIILGIDLGTTYSSMGVYRNGKVEIIPNDQGNLTTPSSVAFTDNELLIGEAAVNQAASNAERTIFDIIRFIGRKFDDETVQKDMEMLPYKVVNKSGRPYVEVNVKDGEVKAFSPEEICAMVLSNMKKTAESYLGKNVAFAIMAVPVYFNAAQKQAIKEAGSIAGYEVIRLLNKPMVAGVAYGFEYGKKHVLVYDLGGRTLDVSIIFINDGLIEISSSSRNTHLGGKDFDDRLMKHFIKIFKKKHGKDISKDSKALGKLNRECERAKRELSSQYQVSLEIESLFDGVDFSETLNRTTFEELNEDLFMETMEYVKKAMENAKLKKTEIHEIILIGGSTMIPKIQDLLKEFFEGKEPVKGLGVNPDEVVAYGAAFLGRFYVEDEWGRDVQRCTDVSLLSLGVETVGGVMTTLVKRCCLPVKNSAIFTTYQDHQTSVEIKVFQGERSLTKDCPELGRFTLSGIASAPRGVPQIEVTFDVSYDNGLIVTAEEKGANNKQSITVQFDHLTMEEVKRMVAEARLFKEEDKKVMESMKPQNQLPIPSQARSNL